MEKKNLFLSALLAGAMFMGNTQLAQAQFNAAANPDLTAKLFTAQVNIQNTGNTQITADNKLFRAMVWDGTGTGGNGAQVFVDYNGTIALFPLGTPIGGLPTDPDIAAYWNPANPGVVRMLVAYSKGTNIQVDRYDYTISTNQISRIVITLSPIIGATYPNVDVNEVGEGVLAYEKNGEIFARTVDLNLPSTPLSTTPFRVDYETPGLDEWWATQPDVAIKKNTSGPGSTISFIYKEQYLDITSFQYHDVIVKQESFSTVQTGGSTANQFGVGYYAGTDYYTQYFPRIAAMHAPVYSDNDYAAVLEDQGAIVSIASNDNAASYNVSILNNSNHSPDLTASSNEKPVISYAGDIPIAAWVNTSSYSDAADIIIKRLSTNGIPLATDYSVVNYKTNGSQIAPSISGTYYDPQALYTFYDKDAQTVLYKSSYYYNVNLRQAGANNGNTSVQVETQLTVYPNPLTENSVVEITLQEANQVKALELYNLTGQKVCSYDLGNLNIGKNRLNLNDKQIKNLPKGMYLLRLTTNQGHKVVKVQH